MDIWLQTTYDINYWFHLVPLAADFTTANIQDNQMYNPMISLSASSLSPETCFMIGDSGYDDHKLYNLSTGVELVCPVQDMNVPLLAGFK